VRLALGPQHLAWSQPSLKGRALADLRLAITHVVVHHAPALPGLVAGVAHLDSKAGQLRVGSGRAGPARRDLQELLLDELGETGQLDWSRVSVDSFSLRATGGPLRRKPGRLGQARVQAAPGR
jgi:hypothetical protein